MFALTKEKGQVFGFPDVCKVPAPPGPPVPTPFPNMGMPQTANPVTQKVFIHGMPALTKASVIQPTNGDQPGVAGGVSSSKIMGPAKFTQGSQKIQLEGNPAVFLGCATQQNDNNVPGAAIAPSQEIVLIMG